MFDKYASHFLHIMTNHILNPILQFVLYFHEYTICILCLTQNKSLSGNHPDRDLKEKRSYCVHGSPAAFLRCI